MLHFAVKRLLAEASWQLLVVVELPLAELAGEESCRWTGGEVLLQVGGVPSYGTRVTGAVPAQGVMQLCPRASQRPSSLLPLAGGPDPSPDAAAQPQSVLGQQQILLCATRIRAETSQL